MKPAVIACCMTLAYACTGPRASANGGTAARANGPSRPLQAHALFERGRTLAERGDPSRAEQYLELAIRAGYPERAAIVPLVRVCIAASRLRAALGYARGYLRRSPAEWRLRYLVAAIESALGRPRKAAQELERVLADRPEAAQAHYLLGVLQRDAFGDPRAARASFRAYLAHAPDGVFADEVQAWLREPRARTRERLPLRARPQEARR